MKDNSVNITAPYRGILRRLVALLVLILGVIGTNSVYAQFEYALYNFKSVAQSNLLNPATRTDMRFSLGLAHTETSAFSTGFTAFQAIAKGSDINENLELILNNIQDRDFVRLNNSLNFLHTTFDVHPRYQVSFGLQMNSYAYMTMPVNLLRLVQGNNQPEFVQNQIQFGDFGFELMQLATYHAGLLYQVNDRLSLGVRLKRHRAMFNFFMDRETNDLEIFFGEEEWRLSSHSTIQSGKSFESMDDLYGAGFTLGANKGFSADIGIDYTLNNRWSISGSILNMGAVRINRNLTEYQSRGNFSYSGVDVDLSEGGFDGGALIDSLVTTFEYKEVPGEAYTRGLPLQCLMGISYRLTPKHEFQSMMQYTQWSRNHYLNISARYMWLASQYFHGMAGVSLAQGRIPGVGAGIMVYVPGVQLIATADYMRPNFNISKVQGVAFNIGLNIALRKRKETPLEGIRNGAQALNDHSQYSPAQF